MIRYTEIEANFMRRPQVAVEECVKMAKVFFFFLSLLGAYFLTNGGQMESLWWLALFWDFERDRDANWGQARLAYFYSSLDTLSLGTLHQLMGPWKLLEVNFSFYSLVAHAFSTLVIAYTHMSFKNIIYLQIAFISTSCKLSSFKLLYLYLANCAITSCKMSSCKLSYLYLTNCHVLLQTVPEPLANCHIYILQIVPSSLANCHLANCCLLNTGPWSIVLLLGAL